MSTLNWDASYAIALALIEAYPEVDIEGVGYEELFEMVVGLAEFDDDVEMVNEGILTDILREWFEEVNQVEDR